MELKEFTEQLNAASTELKNAQAKMAEEIKANGAASEEAKSLAAKADANFTELKGMFDKVNDKLADMEAKAAAPIANKPGEKKSLGQMVIASEAYANKPSNAKSLYVEFEQKDISGLAASAGALIRPDRDPEVYRDPNRPIRIRDLIPSTPTGSNAVEFMRQASFTNNAGPQGTTAGASGGEFAVKGQSSLTWELKSLPIPTIAHWVPASRQILDDAPMLSNLIDVDLNYGLQLESDEQLLLGDGTGQNMTGLLVDSDINDIGQIEAGTAEADIPAAMIDHIRAAVTECQKYEYYNINGMVLNPVDFETLETAKATDGHYILVPFAATNSQTTRIWRVPVVVTNAMPAGQFLLGDWTMGAKIRDRESVSVRVAEQHADLFVKNAVVVLAEERYVLTIPRPKAFTKGQFTVAA